MSPSTCTPNFNTWCGPRWRHTGWPGYHKNEPRKFFSHLRPVTSNHLIYHPTSSPGSSRTLVLKLDPCITLLLDWKKSNKSSAGLEAQPPPKHFTSTFHIDRVTMGPVPKCKLAHDSSNYSIISIDPTDPIASTTTRYRGNFTLDGPFALKCGAMCLYWCCLVSEMVFLDDKFTCVR